MVPRAPVSFPSPTKGCRGCVSRKSTQSQEWQQWSKRPMEPGRSTVRVSSSHWQWRDWRSPGTPCLPEIPSCGYTKMLCPASPVVHLVSSSSHTFSTKLTIPWKHFQNHPTQRLSLSSFSPCCAPVVWPSLHIILNMISFGWGLLNSEFMKGKASNLLISVTSVPFTEPGL